MAALARAGHALPFYPSYHPQEIRLETHGLTSLLSMT
jgi:hypothetical protein